jgi:hypothetical protein
MMSNRQTDIYHFSSIILDPFLPRNWEKNQIYKPLKGGSSFYSDRSIFRGGRQYRIPYYIEKHKMSYVRITIVMKGACNGF